MDKLYDAIVSFLVKNGIVNDDVSRQIISMMSEENANISEILRQYTNEETYNSLLIDLYKNRIIDLNQINTVFAQNIENFLQYFAKTMNYYYFDLDSYDIDYRIASKVSVEKLKKFGALPIKEDELNIYIALQNPLSLSIQEGVQRLFNRKLLKIVIAEPSQVEKFINKMDMQESIKGLIDEIRNELNSSATANQNESSSILKLIEIILKTSILSRGSDIHIEPTENNCIVRARIDGMLSELFIFDKDIFAPLSSRMKLLSNMDIAEKRKPQDGRFSATIMGREYDFRISTLPVMGGESIVLRILDKSKVMIKLENLGMHPTNYERFSKAMKAPYGVIFVTGPTGSGKTTTLYAALNAIKSIQTKIITVEDPVEYQLNLTLQTQVNEKAGLTFAAALRSILRQDPDIIMIGEVRDQETLRIAVQAALTGHLVFSTLHTNDAVSAVTRITDMGIEPYLISGALVAIEAQRLIRKLCPHCKKPITLSQSTLDQLKDDLPSEYTFYKHVGCEKCAQTGYVGREMLSEILPISETLASMVAQGANKDQIKAQALKEGFVNMYKDGIVRAAKGLTTIDEVLRVTKS